MRIQNVKIDKLFEMFDYDISFGSDRNPRIITGANGFGKTMILNIIFNLFNRRFLFFPKLSFERIEVLMDANVQIIVERVQTNPSEAAEVKFIFLEQGIVVEEIKYSDKLDARAMVQLQRILPIVKLDDNRWMDHRNNRIISTEDVLSQFADSLPEELSKMIVRPKVKRTVAILDSIKVHLIREQRLFRKVPSSPDRVYHGEDKDQTIMVESIQTYSKELKQLIAESSQRSFRTSQELDSSYPSRLVAETNVISEENYNKRYGALKAKQDKLQQNGLYEQQYSVLSYSPSDSKALLVYLNDLEKKLGVFDPLLDKLELFRGILNERRFTHKRIEIDRERGFFFKTIKDRPLELSQLSSGEQHEVVLLYELIFNAQANVLVLIDEPEISLHVNWQKEFLNDLMTIIAIRNFQVIIATHSPTIINDRWDLVYTLGEEEAK